MKSIDTLVNDIYSLFESSVPDMEDNEGNLLVLDHPYCNEYYEYALKERILENMIFSGENVSNQLSFIQNILKMKIYINILIKKFIQ